MTGHRIETVPTYDYQCRSCGQITEVVHSMTEEGPTTCERCGGSLRRVLYPAGIIFKGSGFYSTDSRSAGNGARRPSSTTGSTPDAAGKPAPGAAEPGGSTAPSPKKDAPGSGTKA